MKTILLLAVAGGVLWYYTRGKAKAKVDISVTKGETPIKIPGITPSQWSTVPTVDPKDYAPAGVGNYIGAGCHTC